MLLVPMEWANMEFSECDLGDERRTQRLISAAAQTLARPDGSSPEQAETWADCKALYRLMDCDDVSFQAITAPHFERTKRSGEAGSVRLILNDTTEINYGGKRRAKGLGPVGRNTGRGFFLHSALMRDPDSKQVIGLAGQELLYRPKKKKLGAKNSRRRDPEREQAVWGRLIDQVGSPPPDATWLHVCDRGADDYEVFCRAYRQRCGWVIRACRLNRQVISPTGERITLKEHLAAQPVRDFQSLNVPATLKRSARTAELELRFAPLSLPQPKVTNAWIREHAPGEPLAMWAVELLEVDPPTEKERVRWVLLTSQPVETSEQARQIIDYYAQRWAIEEYHKALKTGCQVEARYYREAERLERITGLLSIVAVQLLRLRNLADEQPERPALEAAPKAWINTLAQVRQRKGPQAKKLTTGTMTMAEFVKHLGGLGGHLGRKCDGRPGWQTLWRGLEKLLLILRGRDLGMKKCG